MSLDRSKLVKVMRLLHSEIEGERHAALAAATRMLEAEGVTWARLAESPVASESVSKAAMEAAAAAADHWRTMAQSALGAAAAHVRTIDQQHVELRALRVRLADIEARLDIAARENAQLRRALGPEAAAAAIHQSIVGADAGRRA